jgi:hypothetical protein
MLNRLEIDAVPLLNLLLHLEAILNAPQHSSLFERNLWLFGGHRQEPDEPFKWIAKYPGIKLTYTHATFCIHPSS